MTFVRVGLAGMLGLGLLAMVFRSLSASHGFRCLIPCSFSSNTSQSLHSGPSATAVITDSSASNSPSSYRSQLESHSLPLLHSPTLTFSSIYVLSLPSRLDRRQSIARLANALGLEFTFVDAASQDAPFIRWIAERICEVRNMKADIVAKAGGLSKSKSKPSQSWHARRPSLTSLAPFPSLESTYPSGSWISHLLHHDRRLTLSSLVPSNAKLDVSKLLYDPDENNMAQLNTGVISTWFGHTKAMRVMLERGDTTALILEDDVDCEFNLEQLWYRVERVLPKDWDMVFLVHCWSNESRKPMYLHPNLDRSSSPACLHAYALSAAGSTKLLSILDDPWTAYQSAIDVCIRSYIGDKNYQEEVPFNSFSISPPWIIQKKISASDNQLGGTGSAWRGVLMDSTTARILEHDSGINGRGKIELLAYDETMRDQDRDPATIFRHHCKA